MVGQQTQNTDRPSFIEEKEKELLLMQNEVLRFIDTKHDADCTRKYMKAMREAEIELNNLLLSLIDTKNISAEFKEEAINLCERGYKLKDCTRDINKVLESDLKQIQEKDLDMVKIVGFIAAFPVMLVAGTKNLFGDNTFSTMRLALIGVGLSLLVAGHKKIKPAWKAASDAVCKSSRYIKQRLDNCDVKGRVLAKSKAIRNGFQKNAAMMLKKTSSAAKKGKAFVRSIRDRSPPPAP